MKENKDEISDFQPSDFFFHDHFSVFCGLPNQSKKSKNRKSLESFCFSYRSNINVVILESKYLFSILENLFTLTFDPGGPHWDFPCGVLAIGFLTSPVLVSLTSKLSQLKLFTVN